MLKRIAIFVTLDLLLLCVLAVNVFGAPNPTLKQFYDGYNEQYFMNQLPADTTVVYGDPGQDRMGVTLPAGDQAFQIIISKKFNPSTKEALATLLHEMCHVKMNVYHIPTDLDGHGPNFTAEMRRLAAAGAFDELW